ncbi:nuclear transport factor 2 family protein [Mesorhizobium yinganensis]|uniref:nuclear transport factor 2 family protein n=1 Tax=Mesorhizobium yinganensis TaxID=3157707 RepID=UPI0032B7BC5B
MNAVDTVKKVYELYVGGDMEGALSLCAPEACYAWKADPGYTRFCGTGTGLDQFRQRLQLLQEVFHYNSFRIVSIFGDDERVAAVTELELTHKASNKQVRLENAHFWTVKDGKVTELAEYFDSAMVAEIDKVAA